MPRHVSWAFVVFTIPFVACAEKKAKAGDFCKLEEEGTIVCADGATALLCSENKRKPIPCRGAQGCSVDANKRASCDGSLGREGEACFAEATYVPQNSCSEDKTALLRCHLGRFVLDLRCRGPKGCDPTQPHPAKYPDGACDRSVGDVGDACNTRGYDSESFGACSVDGKQQLACDKYEDGKLVTSRICSAGCKPKKVDGLRETFVPVCDPGVIVAGMSCAKDDQAECSADKAALLGCDHASGKYVAKPCRPKERCIHEKGMTAWCQ